MMPSILVVDDDEQIRSMLRLMLEREGFAITEAGDGNQALERYAEQAADLVIMDIVMPEKEGIETIMDLRRLYDDVKIIAISGGGRVNPEDYLRWARTFGVQHTFTKPVDRRQLLTAVESLMAGEAV
jgi:CheY-like chemotaxis protein